MSVAAMRSSGFLHLLVVMCCSFGLSCKQQPPRASALEDVRSQGRSYGEGDKNEDWLTNRPQPQTWASTSNNEESIQEPAESKQGELGHTRTRDEITGEDGRYQDMDSLTNHPLLRALASAPTTKEALQQLAGRARTELDIPAAQERADDLLRTSRGERTLTGRDIPENIREVLPWLRPFGSVQFDQEAEGRIIFVEGGGGWGHSGLALTRHPYRLKSRRAIFEPVAKGIYAFVDVDHVIDPEGAGVSQ